MKIRSLLLTLVLALSFALAACDFDGGVEQGRCVAFDPAAKTLTIVVDVTHDQSAPHYSGDVHTFKLPAEARDMGPAPTVGGRLMIELEKSALLLYDPDSKSIKELPVQFTDVEKNISAKHPKVAGKTFPVVDKEKHALDLPPYVWTAGDEMRIAYRNADKGQAIRIMNVSKTNIFQK